MLDLKIALTGMKNLVWFVLLASFLLGANGITFAGNQEADDPADWIFQATTLHRVDITIDPERFELMRQQVDDGWTRATVALNGMPYEDVGVETGGHRYTKEGRDIFYSHPTLRLDFGRFRREQRLFGIRQVVMESWCCDDDTLILEYLMGDLMNEFGVRTYRSTYARLTVNDEYIGPVVFMERIVGDLARRLYPGAPSNLYRLENTAGRDNTDAFALDKEEPDNPYSYIPYRFKPISPDNPDPSDIFALVQALNQPTVEEVRAAVTPLLDIDNLINYLIVSNATGDSDGLISVDGGVYYYQNDIYLYHDPVTDRFFFIPWDLDSSFGAYDPKMVNRDLLDGWNRFSITRWMLDDPEIMNRFFTRARMFLDQVFVPDNIIRRIDQMAARIRPSVYEDLSRRFQYPISLTPQRWEQRVNRLKEFTRARVINLRRQLGS